jgi:hypothetical protein
MRTRPVGFTIVFRAVLAVALLAGACGDRQPPDRPPSGRPAPSDRPESVELVLESAEPVPDAPRVDRDFDPPPAAPAPPPAPPPPARDTTDPPPLEEVVARVIPAIVQIETASGRGSGFFVRSDTVVTNVHVVGASSAVVIRRADGSTAVARVTATSPAHDLALLITDRVDPQQTSLPLGSALDVRVGQDVLAIGSALGTLQNTVTRGIVSAVRQSGAAVLVQTDAAVNPGNSGGPLLDRRGTAIAITTMGYIDRQGLNFAVAAEHARALLEGRPGTGAAWTSPVKDLRVPSSAGPSDTERARAAGEQAYEAVVGQLARQADGLDDDWQRYRRTCRQGPGSNQSREWFVLLEDRPLQGLPAPGCAEWLSDLRQRAASIERSERASDEAARRADVYPGTRRDIRRRYRLDFDGWDR